MERAVRSFNNWGGMWRELFGALLFEEGYYKKWRDLFRAIILAERYGESCLKLL